MATRNPTFTRFETRNLINQFGSDLLVNPDNILQTRGGGDYSLYQRVLEDDQCKSAFQQRRMAVTHAETIVEPGGTSAQDKAAADFIRELFDQIDWDTKTDKMLYGVWYGHSVAENLYERDGRFVTLRDIIVRPAGRFRYMRNFDRTEGDGIREISGLKLDGEERPPRKYWTFCHGAETDENPYGMGLARDCYWPSFFKKNDIKFWLYFLERYGQPTAKGAMPRGQMDDPKNVSQMLDILDAIQQDTTVVVPDDTEIDLVEAKRSASADYEAMKKTMDEAMAKLILGQTLTLENTGGQHKATMQKEVRDEIVRADSDLLMGSINRQTVRWLVEWNYPGARVPKVWRKTQPDEDINERAKRDVDLKTLGWKPTQAKFDEIYGEGYEPVQEAPPPVPGFNPANPGQPPVNPADFMEGGRPDWLTREFAETAGILARRALNREDQKDLKQAARLLGMEYEEFMGTRMAQMTEFLEAVDDLPSFVQKLREMAAEEPPEEMRTAIERSGFFARLMGARRNQ